MSARVADILAPDGRAVGAGIFPNDGTMKPLELYRVAYAGDGAELTGLQVIDEFETMSGPVMVTAVTSLGACYDAALTAAFARSAELEIGSGWPPVIVGLDASIPVRAQNLVRGVSAGVDDVEAFAIGGGPQVAVVVTTTRDVSCDALRRAAESARGLLRADLTLVVAVAVGDTRKRGGRWTIAFDDAVRGAVGNALARLQTMVEKAGRP